LKKVSASSGSGRVGDQPEWAFHAHHSARSVRLAPRASSASKSSLGDDGRDQPLNVRHAHVRAAEVASYRLLRTEVSDAVEPVLDEQSLYLIPAACPTSQYRQSKGNPRVAITVVETAHPYRRSRDRGRGELITDGAHELESKTFGGCRCPTCEDAREPTVGREENSCSPGASVFRMASRSTRRSGLRAAVGGEKDRHAALAKFVDQLVDVSGGGGIEARRRFVEEQDFRFAEQSTRQGDPPPQTLGQKQDRAVAQRRAALARHQCGAVVRTEDVTIISSR
jgi:hypothetical protein